MYRKLKYKTEEEVLQGDYITMDYGYEHMQITYLVDTDEKKKLWGEKDVGVFAISQEMRMEFFCPAWMIEGEETDFLRRGVPPPSRFVSESEQNM